MNRHEWQKIKGVLLLSLLNGGLNVATAAAGRGGGNSLNLYQFQSGGEQVANTLLGSTITIPDTLTRIRDSRARSSSPANSCSPTCGRRPCDERHARTAASPDGAAFSARREGVEEICVNHPGELFVRKDGRFTRYEEPALDFDHLLDLVILTAALGKKDATEREPLLFTDLPMPDGPPLRLMAVQPPAVESGLISLTFRKPGDAIHTVDEVPTRYKTTRWNKWKRRKELRDHSAMLALMTSATSWRSCARRCSGDTTCCSAARPAPARPRWASRCSPRFPRASGSSRSRYPGVPLRQPNRVHLLYNQGDGGYANISVSGLLVATMRMRPDRVLLQELLDSEAAATYVQSIVSGHPGSFTTIHGRDPAQAFKRLFGLIKGSEIGRDQDRTWILDLLSSAVDIIVPFENHGLEYEIGEVWFAVRKLCALPQHNPTRKAVFEFDKLIRSIYTLDYLRDPQLQRDVHRSQNPIEAYHQLRAAIAQVGGKKQLIGATDLDVAITNQCGRLHHRLQHYPALGPAGAVSVRRRPEDDHTAAEDIARGLATRPFPRALPIPRQPPANRPRGAPRQCGAVA